MTTIIVKCPDGSYTFEIFDFTKKNIKELNELGVEEVVRPIMHENAIRLNVRGDQVAGDGLIKKIADMIKKTKLTRQNFEIFIEHYDTDLNEIQVKSACEGDLHPQQEIKVEL